MAGVWKGLQLAYSAIVDRRGARESSCALRHMTCIMIQGTRRGRQGASGTGRGTQSDRNIKAAFRQCMCHRMQRLLLFRRWPGGRLPPCPIGGSPCHDILFRALSHNTFSSSEPQHFPEPRDLSHRKRRWHCRPSVSLSTLRPTKLFGLFRLHVRLR